LNKEELKKVFIVPNRTKAQKVAIIWADWNERKISGEEAIYRVGKLFPKTTMIEWNKRYPKKVKQIETA